MPAMKAKKNKEIFEQRDVENFSEEVSQRIKLLAK
jgi:hypothetical protein